MLWALVPSIYLLFRLNIVSINNVDINILGQLEWFDLIDEIIVTSLTVPLYSLLKKGTSSSNKNGLAFILSFGLYFVFTVFICLKVGSISEFMNAEFAKKFLLLQSISMLISYICTFMVILFTLNDSHRLIRVLLISKIVLLIIGDYTLISKFADIGASYSEIIVNSIIAVVGLLLALKKKHIAFGKYSLGWIKDWEK